MGEGSGTEGAGTLHRALLDHGREYGVRVGAAAAGDGSAGGGVELVGALSGAYGQGPPGLAGCGGEDVSDVAVRARMLPQG
jgi:hypothetical protein